MGELGDFGWAGEYRLVSRLGSGGMGAVYLARSAGGRAVAVKTVHPHLAEDPEFRRRFAREAEAAARVGGAFTAPVLAADAEAPVPWLATAFVAGPSISEAVSAFGALPTGSVRTVGAGLAEALRSIHGAGLTHRDLKPSNVLLSASGPRIIDFGLARAEDATAFTATGQAVGTPGYLPPEALEGGETGPAGDVFALGGVLAYAATGRHPYGEGSVVAILRRVLHEPPDLEGVEPGLRELLAACLSADPGQRPDVDTLLEALADTGATGGPAPLPRAVTELIAAREAWAAERLASVPYEEPPEPPDPPEPSDPSRDPNPDPARRRWWPPSGRTVVLVAAAVVLSVVAGFLVPRVWPGAADADTDAAEGPDRPADLSGPAPGVGQGRPEVPQYTLVATHEFDPTWESEYALSRMVLSPDGGTAYLKGTETPLLAVDTGNGEVLYTSEEVGGERIVLSPDGERGAAPGTESSAVVWDPEDGEVLLEVGPGEEGGAVAFAPDGQLVTTDPERGTDLWNVDSGVRSRGIAPTGGDAVTVGGDSLIAFHTHDGQESQIEVWTLAGEPVVTLGVVTGREPTLHFQSRTSVLGFAGIRGLAMADAVTGDFLGEIHHATDEPSFVTVDGRTGLFFLWARGLPPVAVDPDSREFLGPLMEVGDDGADAGWPLALSSDGDVMARVGVRRNSEAGDDYTYLMYVWERD